MAADVLTRLTLAAGVLREVLDVVEGRTAELVRPERASGELHWSHARGWSDFLLGLSDDEVHACERGAFDVLSSIDAPRSLAELSREVAAATAIPPVPPPRRVVAATHYEGVGRDKSAQIEALLGVLEPLATRASRLVDVGAGRGHLTRLASAAFGRGAVGLERDPGRVRAAEELAAAFPATTFEVFDALAAPLRLTPSDLALGLHACGDLGDRLVTEVAASGAALALVSCCFQKVEGDTRAALSQAAGGIVISRRALGLANLSARERGVETSIRETMRAREARFALRCLLDARGLHLAPGEEMRGVNRRAARKGLAELAVRVLAARGLPPPEPRELAAAEVTGRVGFARARRLSVPRSQLSRLVEVTLVLDRAAALVEAGRSVEVGTLFDPEVSPRNLVVLSGFAAGA